MSKYIHSRILCGCAVVVSIVFGIYMMQDSNPAIRQASAIPATPAQTLATAAMPQLGALSRSKTSVTISPFGIDAPVIASRSERIAARRARMEALNYSMPAKYFTMGLEELKKLAKSGDAFAYVQLGEQYSMESDALQSEPGFDPKANLNLLARESFTAAIHVGQTGIATIMAMKALEKNDVVDAFAWKMVTETFRPANATMLNQYSPRFSELTPAQKDEAMSKYSVIIHRLSERLPSPTQD